jgi:hypothetical protein
MARMIFKNKMKQKNMLVFIMFVDMDKHKLTGQPWSEFSTLEVAGC